jgi:hypothetical protein
MTMDEPPVCARCKEEYLCPDGYDPTKYCNSCAHEQVSELEAMLKKLRDFVEFGPLCSPEATNIVLETDEVLRESKG